MFWAKRLLSGLTQPDVLYFFSPVTMTTWRQCGTDIITNADHVALGKHVLKVFMRVFELCKVQAVMIRAQQPEDMATLNQYVLSLAKLMSTGALVAPLNEINV